MTESGRWTKPAGDHGVEPRVLDAEHDDAETARLLAETRAVVNEEEPTGEQGLSADKRGTDPGGYPHAAGA